MVSSTHEKPLRVSLGLSIVLGMRLDVDLTCAHTSHPFRYPTCPIISWNCLAVIIRFSLLSVFLTDLRLISASCGV